MAPHCHLDPLVDPAVGIASALQSPYGEGLTVALTTWLPCFVNVLVLTHSPLVEAELHKRFSLSFQQTRFVQVAPLFDEPTGRNHGLHMELVQAMVSRFHTRWFVIADDDTLLVPSTFAHYIATMKPTPELSFMGACVGMHVGHIRMRDRLACGTENVSHVSFVVGGSGILMTRKLAIAMGPLVDGCRRDCRHMDYSDVKLGACLMRLRSTSKLNMCSPFFVNTFDQLKNTPRQPIAALHLPRREFNASTVAAIWRMVTKSSQRAVHAEDFVSFHRRM